MLIRRSRTSLAGNLDREVYQVICKLIDNDEELRKSGKLLNVHSIYDNIKHSNSSLKRRNKRVLEESIGRVLEVVREEVLEKTDSMDEDLVRVEESIHVHHENNTINKNITKMWVKEVTSNINTTGASSQERILPVKNPLRKDSQSESNSLKESLTKQERQSNGEPRMKRRKGDTAKHTDRSPPTDISLTSLGGVENVIHELNELVAMPMLYPNSFIQTGIQPPRGVLLYGPPGCGKTMIANAFAAEIGVSYISISAPSLVAGMSGESEKKIRDVFEEAIKIAPCLVFIDEIDVIMGKRESAQREMEKRIVAQMLTCMDEIALEKTDGKPVIIVAATNRPDSLDPALRRAGRFSKEINLGVPNELAREKILRALTKKLRLADDFNFQNLAKLTPGFVGADLNDIVSIAGTEAIKRMMNVIKGLPTQEMDLDNDNESTVVQPIRILRSLVANAGALTLDASISITYQDFLSAIAKAQPSAKREGFATIPDTTWSHIGALHSVREQLQMAIVEPIKNPEIFARVGITAPAGVLLWGPPGCGKTLLAKAVANESKANFISIKGPELLNKYVGESERAVRQVFERARSSIPCILFFDELDALVPKREDTLSEASSKVVNTLLTELDGLSSRFGIYVVAATNRPDMIDPAMLRPGRLGTSVFVDLPTADERVEILKALYKKALPLATNEDIMALEDIARDIRCSGYSGADLGSLHQSAAVAALKRTMISRDAINCGKNVKIERLDWEIALGTMRASVKDAGKYRKLKERGM